MCLYSFACADATIILKNDSYRLDNIQIKFFTNILKTKKFKQMYFLTFIIPNIFDNIVHLMLIFFSLTNKSLRLIDLYRVPMLLANLILFIIIVNFGVTFQNTNNNIFLFFINISGLDNK